jgi:sucrose phosphorylase
MDNDRIRALLVNIYGEERSASYYGRLNLLLDTYRSRLSPLGARILSERDAILITYPDQIQENDRPPLQTLTNFCKSHIKDVISGIHILPFYPWSSDDGFSVIDYRAVDPRYGSWDDIQELGKHFDLMFDAVINHISIQSEWFQGFLNGDETYLEYFIPVKGSPDLSTVVRPRALPLLTTFETKKGDQNVWTTFGADQVDLNYRNPEVLLEVIDILLRYVSMGARFIRLDAIAYLWKDIRTKSIHLPQTHWVIQLFRAVLDAVAPHVQLITETNVPHEDNISYFHNGSGEAQLVYNFSLPPLVLHAFQTGSAETLSRWAASLRLPSNKVTFFNFLASHDGIGLNPLRGILPAQEIDEVVNRILAHGGLVSFKSEPDGSKIPYELNINFFDALNDPAGADPLEIQVDRFITAHAILLAMVGLPGIYFHSLVGSRGWLEGIQETGRNRTINRKKFNRIDLETRLLDPGSRESEIFIRMKQLLRIRNTHAAFHPHGKQEVLNLSPGVFGLWRSSPSDENGILCLHNVSGRVQELDIKSVIMLRRLSEQPRDTISGKIIQIDQPLAIQPYQTLWIE